MRTIIFALLLIVNIAYTQENIPKDTKRIFTKDYMIYGAIEVVTDSTELQGFLIFQFVKYPQAGIYHLDHDIFTCDIYFSYSLEDFKYNSNLLLYNTAYIGYGDYCFFHNDEYGTKEYLRYCLIYNKFDFLRRSVNSDFERGNNLYYLNTNIFRGDSISYWYNGSEDTIFTVYNVSIPCAILKYDMIYYNTDDKITGDFKKYIFKHGYFLWDKSVIMPTNRTHYFAVVKDSTMLENGFKKSNWVPPNLFNN